MAHEVHWLIFLHRDIQYSLLSYGGAYPDYPSHNTHAGKVSYAGKLGNLKFEDPKPRAPIHTGHAKLDELLEQLIKFIEEVQFQLGDTPEMDALVEAMKYPFRSHAVKTVVFVRGETKTKFQPLVSNECTIAYLSVIILKLHIG